jgi:hypothetical protein
MPAACIVLTAQSSAGPARCNFNDTAKMQIRRQKSFAAASLPLMPSPTDPSERIAEVLREILFLTTDRSLSAASEAKKEKDSKPASSEQEQKPKS